MVVTFIKTFIMVMKKKNKIFHSILNDDKVKEFNNSFVDIYKITSPGIVYFIGNKYIILRCPEIE